VGVRRNVAIRMDHFAGEKDLVIPVQMARSGCDTTWRVRPYHGEVRLLKDITLPEHYLMERSDPLVAALLQRHHIAVDTVRTDSLASATVYMVDSVGSTVLEEDTIPLVSVSRRDTVARLRPGELLVSTRQLQSLLIPILLEPESNWGLTKYDMFSYLIRGKRYPILRLP